MDIKLLTNSILSAQINCGSYETLPFSHRGRQSIFLLNFCKRQSDDNDLRFKFFLFPGVCLRPFHCRGTIEKKDTQINGIIFSVQCNCCCRAAHNSLRASTIIFAFSRSKYNFVNTFFSLKDIILPMAQTYFDVGDSVQCTRTNEHTLSARHLKILKFYARKMYAHVRICHISRLIAKCVR